MGTQPSLDEDGYTLLPGLLSPDEVSRIHASVSRLRSTRTVGVCERPNNTLVPLRWRDAAIGVVLDDATRVERVREASHGCDLRWTSGYISIKDPCSGPLWWHQDWWCWDHPVTSHRQAAQVALLCYLTDTTVRSGALRVLPGSHVRSSTIHALLVDAHPEDPSHPAASDCPGQVTLELEAGDAVLIDYRLLHGTHPNTLDARRDCLVLNFAPSWSRLPDDVRAHLVGGLALPVEGERESADATLGPLLPTYQGVQRDLTLARNAPARFSHDS